MKVVLAASQNNHRPDSYLHTHPSEEDEGAGIDLAQRARDLRFQEQANEITNAGLHTLFSFCFSLQASAKAFLWHVGMRYTGLSNKPWNTLDDIIDYIMKELGLYIPAQWVNAVFTVFSSLCTFYFSELVALT